MKKINFVNGTTINGAETFNQIQDNIEDVFNGNEPMGSIVVDDISCKNLLDITSIASSNNCTYITTINSISVTASGTNGNATTKSYNLLAGDYTISCQAVADDYIGLAVYIDGSYYTSSTGENIKLTFTLSKDSEVSFKFYASSSSSSTNGTTTYSNVLLEKGKVATNYVPHKEFSNKQIYSTSEQLIGSWNGKPLYRKTIETTLELPFVSSVTIVTVDHYIANIDKVVNTRMTDGLNIMPTLSTSGGITLLQKVDAQAIHIRYVNDGWSSRTWYFVLEYTKTTD